MTNTDDPPHTAAKVGWDSSTTAACFALAVAVAMAALLVGTWSYLEDDAFIGLEFGRNFAAGLGYAFKGHVAYGNSSPLWTPLLVAAHAFAGDWFVADKLLNALAAAAALAGAFRLASAVAKRHRLHPALPYAATLLVIAGPFFLFWVFSGMEAVLALAVALWMAWLAAEGTPSTGRLLMLAALAGFAPLVRGELVLLSGLSMAVAAERLWRQGRWTGTADSPRHAGRGRRGPLLAWVALAGLMAALPLAIWSWYAVRHFGSVVPNTNSAKRILNGRPATPFTALAHLAQVAAVGYGGQTAVALAAALLLWASRRRRARQGDATDSGGVLSVGEWLLLVGWPALLALFYTANRTAVQTRYLVPAGDFLSILALVLVFTRARGRGHDGRAPVRHPHSAPPEVWWLLPQVALLFAAPLVIDVVAVRPHLHNKAQVTVATRDFAGRARRVIPPDAPIAIYSFGQLGFELPNPLVDLGGLVQPEGQPYLADPQAMHRWAISRGARYFIAPNPPPPDLEPLLEWRLPATGWYFSPRAWEQEEVATLGRLRPRPARRPATRAGPTGPGTPAAGGPG